MDTAVIMYAGGREHPLRQPCQRLIERIAAGAVDGVTSAEVIQEILHRFLLTDHETGVRMARHALDLFAPVLAVTHAVMDRMPQLARQHPALTARDLVHVATCAEYGIDTIVSPDQGFDAVTSLRRTDPAEADRL